MFMYNETYIKHLLQQPGGLISIVARWFTQWYINPWIGAIFPSTISVLFGFLISKKISNRNTYFISAFLLMVMMHFTLKDHMMAGAMAMLLTTCCLFADIKSPVWRIASSTAISVIAGPLAGLTYTLSSFHRIYELLPPLLVFTLFQTTVSSQYSFIVNFLGCEYYRDSLELRYEPYITGLFIIFIGQFRRVAAKGYVAYVLCALSVIAFSISAFTSRAEEVVLQYDKLARQQRWNDIIHLADKHPLSSKTAALYTNLSLAQTGRIGDKLFHYEQFGEECLIPRFMIDPFTAMAGAEVFYWLGLVNTAERFTFEAQEAIPNGDKSVRAIKKLAQCNIIKGDYKVAMRYLSMLKQTACYRRWATQAEEYIKNDRSDDVAEWSTIRKRMINDDNYFSERDFDKTLAQLVVTSSDFGISYNYLLSLSLLKKDLQMFKEYYRPQVFKDKTPLYYKEAYIYNMLNDGSLHLKELQKSDHTLANRIQSFIQMYQANPDDSRLSQFKDMFIWYVAYK